MDFQQIEEQDRMVLRASQQVGLQTLVEPETRSSESVSTSQAEVRENYLFYPLEGKKSSQKVYG